MKKNFLIMLVLLLSGLAGFALSWYHHQHTMSETDVHIIETFHSPALFVKQIENDPAAGYKIFKEFCGSCHDKEPRIDVGAPRINEKKRWSALRKLGVPALLKTTIDGVGAMPARGGCFECSDKQLQQAIVYMLGQ